MNAKAIAAALLITTAAFGLTACNEKDEPVAVPVAASTPEAVYTPEPTTPPPTTTRPRATAPRHTAMEETFLEVLRERGIPVRSESQMIDLGKQTCETLDAGATIRRVLSIAGDAMGNSDGGFFVGVSIAAFCDEYAYLVG